MSRLEKFLTNKLSVFLIATFCCLLWGSAFPLTQVAYAWMGVSSSDIPSQLLLAGVRFIGSGLLVITFMSLVNKVPFVPKKNDWGKIWLSSLFQTTLQYSLIYIALSKISSAKCSIIFSLAVFTTLLMSALVFKQEKLTGRKMIGCALGFIGVVIVNLSGQSTHDSSVLGIMAVIGACIASSFSYCFMKEWSREINPVLISGWQFLAGGVTLFVVGMAMGGTISPVGPSAWWLSLYMSFISAAGFSLWAALLRYNTVSSVGVYSFENPVFGVLLSIAFFGNTAGLSWVQATAALVLVSIGIVVVNIDQAPEQIPPIPTDDVNL